MKNKNFLRVLAIVCVLVLCVGVLAACNKGGGNDNNGGNNNGGNNNGGNNGNPAGDAMNAFVNTMFKSANEIANGTSFELADGKNIALSLGAAITLKKDGGALEKLPIELALKGFIDRENVVDKYIEDANGAYVLSGNTVTIITDTTELKEGEVRVSKEENGYVVDNANGAFVAKFVAFDSTNSAQSGYTRYAKAVALTSDNETYLDVSARINGIDSFRLIYENDFLYVTIAGNKVGVDLSSLEKTANGQTVKDTLFTMVEGLLRNDAVKGIVSAFNGENFDLNEVITGLINTFVKKEYMPYSDNLINAASRNRYNEVNGEYVKDDNGELVVKTLADTIFEKEISFSGISINNMLAELFGGKENFYRYFGETLDVQGILTADLGGSPFASSLFSEPQWKTWKNGKFVTANKGYASVKSDLSQKLSATIALNPFGFGDSIALVKNSAIKLGFEKEAGANGSVGKMSKFFIDLNLPAGENNRTFGVELAINDLKIGNSKDAISTTVVNKEEYGAMNFDAGLDFDFGEDLLSLIAHDFTDPDGLTIEVGGDDLKFDKDTNTLVVPETLKFNVKGSLDFVNLENTRVVATLKANDKTFAKLQFYAVNVSETDTPAYDLQLDAKVMDGYTDVIPAILDMCVVLGKNGGIGVNGFKKVNIGGEWKWGFYDAEGNDKVGDVLYSVYEEDANGNYGLNAETNEYFLLTDENSASYTGAKYKKYNVSYSYAKVNESLNHLIMNGEAHVTGLNFVKLVNYLINNNGNGFFVNYDENKAEAAAKDDITISDIIMNLLLKADKGILPAVHGIIGIDKAEGLDNSLVIGGDNLLATTFNNLFDYKTDKKIDAVGMIALTMKYFTKYQVIAAGKTYDSVEVYKEFETELYKMNARGIYANGLSKQLMLARPAGYVTDGEKYFAENKATATTDNMKQYGYAVVEDAAGNKYLYPYALYEELVAKKNDVTYLAAEGFNYTDGKLVLVNTPDKLFDDIISKLNAENATADNYLDVAGAELRQAYRLGKTYVPYYADNEWKVVDKAVGTSVNAEIINDIGLKIIVGTQKTGDRATYGTATVEGKVYGKTFTIKGYVNFLTSDPTSDKDIDENLVSEETKNKSFDLQILNPQTYNK